MSKYIKLEDALKAVRDNTMPLDCWHVDRMRAIRDLPTIEVSEDCISKAYLEQGIENQTMTVNEEYWRGWNNALDKVVELIEDAPSVVPRLDKEDLEDIKEHISESYIEGYMDGHAEGEWISQEQGAFYPVECSNCHKQPLLNEDEDYEYTKYCPYCGAKMKV